MKTKRDEHTLDDDLDSKKKKSEKSEVWNWPTSTRWVWPTSVPISENLTKNTD